MRRTVYILLAGLMAPFVMAGAEEAAPAVPAPPAAIEKEHPMVVMTTSKGDITIKLFEDKAPETVANFLAYVDDGHYDNTIFHRVIEGFMIQGGGFTPDMNQKATKPPVKNEAANGLKNNRGTLAMARSSVINSATSQFFINVVDNDFLNYRNSSPAGFGYCVFGEVVDGMDVVDAIRQVETTRHGPYSDVPAEAVIIEKAVRQESAAAE